MFFFKLNIINHILKFLPKFNTNYDNFFLIFNKIEHVMIFVVWWFLFKVCNWFFLSIFYSSLILGSKYFALINSLGIKIKNLNEHITQT